MTSDDTCGSRKGRVAPRRESSTAREVKMENSETKFENAAKSGVSGIATPCVERVINTGDKDNADAQKHESYLRPCHLKPLRLRMGGESD